MIPAALVPPHAAPAVRWQQLWREAVRDPRELLAMLGLDPIATGMSDEACAQFALRVPRGFVARMRAGDPHDPLLRQVLPLDAELRAAPGFALDAVGDSLAKAGQAFVPYTKDWRLNERHYGALTGLDKAETAARHGEEQVRIWPVSYTHPSPRDA